MTKRCSRFLTFCFCGFLGGMLLWHLALPDRAQSETENRLLAQRPPFSWAALADGSFTRGVEAYFADQFPLRDQWTGLKARMEQAMGKAEFHGVYLCGDTLIARVDPPEEGLEEKNLAYLTRLAASAEAPVYLGLIPSAAEVWRDLLPEGAESWDQSAYWERAKATEGLAGTADIFGALASHGAEPVFYRTDHHWTSLGAYCGYTALLASMGETPTPLGEPETVSDDFYGTLYSASGVHWIEPDTIERYVPGEGVTVENFEKGETHGLYVDSFLGEKDKYASFLGGNTPLYIVRNPNAATDKKLLVVRDSYSDSLAPFLSQYFSEIHLLDLRYYRTSVAQYAQENSMDQIFVCYSVENFAKDLDAIFLAR